MIELRVAGLWVREGGLLLVQHEKRGERYWVVPGGHVAVGERLAEALAREFREELRADVRVGDLVFADDFVHESRHVVDLYFRVEPVEPEAEPVAVRDGAVRAARFFTADELASAAVRPSIAPALAALLRTGRAPRVYLGPW